MQGEKTKLEKLKFQDIRLVRCEEKEPDYWVTTAHLVYFENSGKKTQGP